MNQAETILLDNIILNFGEEINKFLKDDNVNEIMVNSNKTLYIDTASDGLLFITNFDSDRALRIIRSVAHIAGANINTEHQFISVELPYYKVMNGERFVAQIPPLTPSPSFTIRKKSKKIFDLNDYVNSGRMKISQRDSLIEAIEPGSLANDNPVLPQIYGNEWALGSDELLKLRQSALPKNVLVCGGPGTGKTTVTNSLIKKMIEINPGQRIGAIEKMMSELQCRGDHLQQFISNHRVSMTQCVEIAMVSRLDRILVGEVKGAEALGMLKAWNTGTPGGIATIHANNALECLQRVSDLAMEAGLTVPPTNLIMLTINVIVSVSRNGSEKGFINEVLFLQGSEHDEAKWLDKVNFRQIH